MCGSVEVAPEDLPAGALPSPSQEKLETQLPRNVMPATGPRARFSPENPHWRPRWVREMTGRDFARAWQWEIYGIHLSADMALLVRMFRGGWWKLTCSIAFRNWLRDNRRRLIREMKAREREAGLPEAKPCGSGIREAVEASG
jgi:hypothetical protein